MPPHPSPCYPRHRPPSPVPPSRAVAGTAVSMQMLHIYYQAELDAGRKKPGSDVILPVTFALTSALAGSQAVVQVRALAVA